MARHTHRGLWRAEEERVPEEAIQVEPIEVEVIRVGVIQGEATPNGSEV